MRPEFAHYHRQRRRALLPARVASVLAAVLLLSGFGWAIASAQAPGPTSAAATPPTAATTPADPNAGPAAPPPTDTPSVLAGQPSIAPDPAAPDPAGPATASPGADPDPATITEPRPQLHAAIAVATRGFQVELDRCQWVRMDVGAVAPIVGAHNYCQGDVVLQLEQTDLVTITGTELDGDYQVTGSRDAHAGDDAAAATAGLTADLLLQTCYWDDSGVRLVTLRRVDLALAPTPAAAP